jgi:hypothetical protein
VRKSPNDPWWVDSPEDQNDFRVYARRLSDGSGEMPPLDARALGKILGVTTKQAQELLREALEALRKATPKDQFYPSSES